MVYLSKIPFHEVHIREDHAAWDKKGFEDKIEFHFLFHFGINT